MSVLAPGLLVAAPPLGDPNFDRSVVLLAAHGPDGAFGWVVNGREVMTVPELLMRTDITEHPIDVPGLVRVGGPVAREQVWLLYRTEERFADMEGQFDVGPGITACASKSALEEVAKGNSPRSLVGLLGYAGWAPDQLENEIRAGAWLPTDVHPAVVFDVASDEVWADAYRRIGATPMSFTTRTVGKA
ncbi:MAG: YqgE/AlgH family protein [Myxococcales bacterium]|nr:YqgE/AlgH family protein [Myxococcales bacterium]